MLKVDHSKYDCLRVQTRSDNLRASGFDHLDGVLAVTIHAGESSYTLTGTRDDMLAIAEVAAGAAGATVYDPKDDADSEIDPNYEEALADHAIDFSKRAE